MLCKYYSPVHTATTEQSNIVSPHTLHIFRTRLKTSQSIPFHETTALHFPSWMKYRIHVWCVMRRTWKRWLVCSRQRQETFMHDPSHPVQTPPLWDISLRGSRGSETDRFLNHSWALPRKERHAESWGTAMRNVSLFLSYAMIYDTMDVTDLIITVYFPSEG